MILHTVDALVNFQSSIVLLRSPSGDTDIMVLAIALFHRVYYNFGVGKYRKCIIFTDYDVTQKKEALIRFYAMTGNDYISALFGTSKTKCWKVIQSKASFLTAFKDIGSTWDFSADLINAFEMFICKVYGCRSRVTRALHKKVYEWKQNTSFSIFTMLARIQ